MQKTVTQRIVNIKVNFLNFSIPLHKCAWLMRISRETNKRIAFTFASSFVKGEGKINDVESLSFPQFHYTSVELIFNSRETNYQQFVVKLIKILQTKRKYKFRVAVNVLNNDR